MSVPARQHLLPLAVLGAMVLSLLAVPGLSSASAADERVCAPAASTDWEGGPTRGSIAPEEEDCFVLDVGAGDTLRVQTVRASGRRTPVGRVVDGEGRELCSVAAGRLVRCVATGSGPYRLLVTSVPESFPPDEGSVDYRVHVTVVDSPGCARAPLATFGDELPIEDSEPTGDYACFRITAGDHRTHVLSTHEDVPRRTTQALWSAWGRDGSVHGSTSDSSTSYESLTPGAEYLLVRTTLDTPGPGAFRAGLYDTLSDEGCPTVSDVGILSPAIPIRTDRGRMQCRRLPTAPGAAVVNRGVTLHGNHEALATIYSERGFDCAFYSCRLGPNARLITAVPGDYRLSDVADTRRCRPWPDRLQGGAPPVVVDPRPGQALCWTLPAGSGQVVSRLTTGIGPHGYADPGYGTVWTRDAETCGVSGADPIYGWCDDPHVFTTGDPGGDRRLSILLRRYAGPGSDGCEPMTLERPATAELGGMLDEACFTIDLPRNFLIDNPKRVLEGPEYSDNDHPVETIITGPDGAVVCGDNQGGRPCRTFRAGRHTVSLRNVSEQDRTVAHVVRENRARYLELPRVVGSSTPGGELRLVGGRTDHNGFVSVTVTWLRDGTVVGRGSTYAPTAQDVGHVVRPRVRLEYYLIEPGEYLLPGRLVRGDALAYRGRLAISGTPRVGERLSARVSTARVSERGVRVRYAWLRDGEVVRGARSAAYRVSAADRGHRLQARAVVTKRGHRSLTLTTPGRRMS